MKKLGLIVIILITNHQVLAKNTNRTDETDRMTTLYQCGENTERGFNGWYINGITNLVNVYFDNKNLEFYSEQGGSYSIEMTKKIEEMVGFNELNVSIDFNEIMNCNLHDATAYVSADGKQWKGLNKDLKNGAVTTRVEKMNCIYLRIIANISFYNQGRFSLKRALVHGEYNTYPLLPNLLTENKSSPAAVQKKEQFFVFNFENKVNIETQNDKNYEFILTNLAGQVIRKETSNGSNRFEMDVPEGIYFITIVQNNKIVTTKKVVL